MSYQVLARKWRPKAFSEVVGQEHVLTILSNALSLGRVHHAYLFSGTRGVGKTSIARLLAKGLNCESGITATPCGVCDNCRDIEQGRFVDLLEIDAASRTKVEDTREILDNIQYFPTKGRFKVYLIDEVHMLSRSSFNALLKTLEEPPEHVKFLLATTDPQKLPITILSRCLHLHLSALDNELIQKQLIKILQVEQINQEEKAVQLLAKAANGSMRDALSLTDQAIALGNGNIDVISVSEMLGTLDRSIPFMLIEALYQGDGNTLMEHLKSVSKQGIDWDSLLTETITLLYQISFLQIVPSAMGDYADYEDRIRYLAQHITPNDIQLYYQILLTGRKELTYAPDKKIGVEMSFLRALAFAPKTVGVSSSEAAISKNFDSNSSPRNIGSSNHETSATVASSRPNHQSIPLEKNSITLSPKKSDSPALDNISDATKSILAARQQIIDTTAENEKAAKKSERVERNQPAKIPTHGNRVIDASIVNESGVTIKSESNEEIFETSETAETYQWQFSEHFTPNTNLSLDTKSMRLALEHEKTPELNFKLIQEAANADEWSAEIESLILPPLIKQIAINAFIEQPESNQVILHLRSSVAHLAKNQTSVKKLAEILSNKREQPIDVQIIVDDELSRLTPLEVREKIYQTKLDNARKAIYKDDKVTMICQFFEAKIDDESVRPV